ncbi:MAG: IS110 family transposase [Trichocoleus desertorum ATA4-8-CV12]|jgi:transposase|nr:IS110 family transposase [Trichocoleus desertorum ATA4-8-CV12]
MQVTHERCAGIDVHKKTVVVCCLNSSENGKPNRETRTYGTTTRELLSLCDWLSSEHITHVAMESTGEYWKPVYNLLESSFEVRVVNSHHFKQVPGRKTDVKDAEWLAELLSYGLVRGSFIPPLPQRDLRDLTRQRTTLIRDKACVINRLQKVLEWANLKLASVVTDISGVSARAMLKALVNGTESPEALAEHAKGRLRRKQSALSEALTGRVREHHRFLIQTHLEQLEFLEAHVQQFDERIEQLIQSQSLPPGSEPLAPADSTDDGSERWLSWQQAMTLLDTIPGVARRSAELLLAEVGVDMGRFPSAAHLCKWAGICPGNHESAGKQYSGKTPPSNRWLRGMLVQMANAAVRCKTSYFASVYRRLAPRRGHKRAIVAVAHRLLIAVYHMLKQHQPYRDYRASDTGKRSQEQRLKRLQQQVERLGYQVQLVPLTVAQP